MVTDFEVSSVDVSVSIRNLVDLVSCAHSGGVIDVEDSRGRLKEKLHVDKSSANAES